MVKTFKMFKKEWVEQFQLQPDFDLQFQRDLLLQPDLQFQPDLQLQPNLQLQSDLQLQSGLQLQQTLDSDLGDHWCETIEVGGYICCSYYDQD